jgi:lambda family phage portal protein
MATYSKHGRLLGRPPKSAQVAPIGASVPNPRIRPAAAPPDAQALAIGRATMQFMARYDAAGRGKRVASWTPPSTGPNEALSGLQMIRNRARDTVRNDWSGESLIQKWSTTLIGIGITPRFKRVRKARKQAVLDLWHDFVAACDADGVLNLYGLQTLVVRAWLESGECFVRRRPRFADEGLPVPMQMQVLESDMCPLFTTDSYAGLPTGHKIKDGIEFNKRGRRMAYWFYKEHPGDMPETGMIGPDTLVRVLASDVAHVYEPHRPGARRGVSILAPVIMHLRNTGDYVDTTLERQKLANLWVGFITRELPKFDPNEIDADPMSGLQRVMDEAGNGLLPLRPGLIQELEDGQTFNFANPPEAGTMYSDYIRTSHLGTSAGGGMPYELFSGDIRGISDRAMRVLINEFRRHAEQRQWQIVIPQFCQRAVNWFVDAAVLQGAVPLEDADETRRVEHAPHGWAYIHPVQDPQGKLLEIRGGIRSRSSVIGEKGDDPEDVDDERQADDQREQELEIGPYSLGMRLSESGDVPAEEEDEDEDEDEDDVRPLPNARIRQRTGH